MRVVVTFKNDGYDNRVQSFEKVYSTEIVGGAYVMSHSVGGRTIVSLREVRHIQEQP